MKGRVTFESREEFDEWLAKKAAEQKRDDRIAQATTPSNAADFSNDRTFNQHRPTYCHEHDYRTTRTLTPTREHAHVGSFLSTYVFSRDHKIIGIQFLFSTLFWFFVGGLLALGVRWQLAWPWSTCRSSASCCSRPRAARSRPNSTRCSSRCTPR